MFEDMLIILVIIYLYKPLFDKLEYLQFTWSMV